MEKQSFEVQGYVLLAGMTILEIEVVDDGDYVRTRISNGETKGKISKSKVHWDVDGNPYFNTRGMRIETSDIIKVRMC